MTNRLVTLAMVLGLGWLWAVPLAAQQTDTAQAQPATYPDTGFGRALEDGYPGKLLSYPGSSSELPPRPLELPAAKPEAKPDLPPGARPGIFQKASVTGAWLAPGGSGGLGIYELGGRVVLGFPFPLLHKSHLVITPGFGVNYLDGPVASDLPPQVFEAYTGFRVMYPMTPKVSLAAGVTPGVYSDFKQSGDEAVRVPANAMVIVQYGPKLKLIGGVAYLDREDINVLPMAGAIWTPCEEWRLDIVMPRPRIARRLYWGGRLPADVPEWLYLGGEWGGGSWAVRRSDGSDDVATLSDYRLILGWERTADGGSDVRFEVGYVFGRQVDYLSGTPGVDPDDTILMRGGWTY